MEATSSHDLRISNIWMASDGVLVLLLGYRHFHGVLFFDDVVGTLFDHSFTTVGVGRLRRIGLVA
jgi:hypothetical protein